MKIGLILTTFFLLFITHIIIVKLNSRSYNYIGVRVRLGLGFLGQRGEVRVRIIELSTPCKN